MNNEDNDIEDWLDLIHQSPLTQDEKDFKIDQVEKAFNNNVPVIFNLEHLSALTGFKSSVITKMVNKPTSFYRKFKIKKKRGGYREIVTPHKSLLEIQQWVSKYILSQFKIHEAAFGYVKQRNVALNSKQHIGCNEMLKIDLKDFFPSIKTPRIRELFNRIGYSKDVAYYLTKLCCLDDCLPQGAATSPVISNIILKTLDSKLASLAKDEKVIYSRYADDMVFSGSIIPFNLEYFISQQIQKAGFQINSTKTKKYLKDCRKMVTGIVVGENTIRLPKVKRREIKQQVHYLIKHGVLDQVKLHNDIFYIDRVLGKLSYWKQIEPQNEFVLNSIKQIKKMYNEFLKT